MSWEDITNLIESIKNIVDSIRGFFNAVNIFDAPGWLNFIIVLVIILAIWWAFKWLVKQILLLPFKLVSRSIKAGIRRNKDKKKTNDNGMQLKKEEKSNYDW